MDFSKHKGNFEQWFLSLNADEFPSSTDYVSTYSTIASKLKPVHSQVNLGADSNDGTSLTWHDESHIKKVIKQVSRLLSYDQATITPFESFVLLVAIQIHDIKNIEGREEHENRAISIFEELGIQGIIDSITLKNIGFIASCHAGSYIKDGKKEKDKIGNLLKPVLFNGDRRIRPQFLAALLRLADEFADDVERAMSYMLSKGMITRGSIIHQKHAESLFDTDISPNTGIVNFDYHIKVNDAKIKFPKYVSEKETYEDIFLLDEIFSRTVKSHYETVYCMRFLRPYISINKLHVSIELEHRDITHEVRISYELIEKGYPSDTLSIIELCGDQIRKNGGHWSGQNLSDYISSSRIS
ncbi:HD domain-containing protein [Spirosoma rhododendri]|uniref:HD-CE domain-containing protein n=1 Tax=Spirosoma rhododendri TaxID=2728024 RepID=A0A7L5DUE8_9BACT|nr:hypothetical protein [Spirosoma rhododendri]QJD81695.1 hypothetical protein HH216_25390 [Spirosoma rhododendri]